LLVRKIHANSLARQLGLQESWKVVTLPAARINPLAVQVLRELDIDWTERTPKGIDAVANRGWDLIITVCDQAKETGREGEKGEKGEKGETATVAALSRGDGLR
jgi:protein-tyrosine-phosphatase